jgi:hypothetical protein
MNENRTSDLRENKSPGYTLIGFRKPFQNAAPKLLIQRSHRKHLLGFRKEMFLGHENKRAGPREWPYLLKFVAYPTGVEAPGPTPL